MWAIASYETGTCALPDAARLEEVAGRWDEWFELSELERSVLAHHRGDDFEWVELVLPGLWQLMCDSGHQDWGVEALRHLAHQITVRMFDINAHAPRWAAGTAVARTADGSANPLRAVVLHSFPNVAGVHV